MNIVPVSHSQVITLIVWMHRSPTVHTLTFKLNVPRNCSLECSGLEIYEFMKELEATPAPSMYLL